LAKFRSRSFNESIFFKHCRKIEQSFFGWFSNWWILLIWSINRDTLRRLRLENGLFHFQNDVRYKFKFNEKINKLKQ
jgi:hypothetical protein